MKQRHQVILFTVLTYLALLTSVYMLFFADITETGFRKWLRVLQVALFAYLAWRYTRRLMQP